MKPQATFTNLPDRKRKKIIRVALEEFSEKGFQNTSINTIVRRLGIAKGSIFQYFQDKQGLFLYLFNLSLENVKDTLKAVRDRTAEDDFFSRLEQTLRAGVSFITTHPLLYRLYLRVLFESQVPCRQEILLSLRRYSRDYLRALIKTAKQRNELKPDLDADTAGFILDSVLDRFLQAQCIEHLDAGLGLYRMNPVKAEIWITQIIAILKDGMANRA